MCFSGTASFIAGTTLSLVGVATIKKAKRKAELPFATIPLLFGIQQIIEGIVWISFSNPTLNVISTYAYSMFSHVLWPIFIPVAILLLEKDPARKKILHVLAGIGLAVGIFLFYFILANGVTARTVNNSIAYISSHLYLPLILTLYVLATCVSFFISSSKTLNVIGIVMSSSFFIAGLFFNETFISVWCFFAAVLSIIIYWYFRRNYANPQIGRDYLN